VLILRTLLVGPIQTNCYLIGDEATKDGVVIDPGGDPDLILDAIDGEGLAICYILNTHAHFDHMMANSTLVAATGAPLALHREDRELLSAGGGATWFGLLSSPPTPEVDVELSDGQELAVGGLHINVLHTPGHSPGHVSFFLPRERVLFSGDALFHEGIGRTDLPGGDYNTLIASIRHKLLTLPDETVVYPGHGPATTIGSERRHNPHF
jgi:glyoxylase-like metal-dependent hydrolase (beta-lactamase superfamily II)